MRSDGVEWSRMGSDAVRWPGVEWIGASSRLHDSDEDDHDYERLCICGSKCGVKTQRAESVRFALAFDLAFASITSTVAGSARNRLGRDKGRSFSSWHTQNCNSC